MQFCVNFVDDGTDRETKNDHLPIKWSDKESWRREKEMRDEGKEEGEWIRGAQW